MAVDIDQVRAKYATNRDELLDRIAESYQLNLLEWNFTEVSVKEVKGTGNDILVIFNDTLTKDGEIGIKMQEIIDYHRLKYSWSYSLDIDEEIPESEENPEEET